MVRAGVPIVIVGVMVVLSGGAAQPAPAPAPTLDLDDPAPGVVATFVAMDAAEKPPAVVRVVADLAARWGPAAPDPRLPVDEFQVRWSGALLIQSPGPHRFFARTDGAVTLTVSGRVVVGPEIGTKEAAAIESSPIDLPPGFAPIVLEYRHARGDAHVAIDWEGPGFAREPLPGRLLFHDREAGDTQRLDRFEDGRRQADRLGCANCHQLLDLPRHSHLGPPLTDAGRAIAPGWLEGWLNDPTRQRPRTRMPAFGHGLAPREVADLVAFLEGVAPRPKPQVAEVKMALNVASVEKGRLLFRSIGCLGCHTRGEAAAAGVPDDRNAPDLSDLGVKRSTAWLSEYLHHPKKGTPSPHRADLRLTADDAAHLAAYLVTDPPAAPPPGAPRSPRGDARRGKELATRLRCAACHEIPDLAAPAAATRLTAGARPDAGCLADPLLIPPVSSVPRYALTDDQRQSLRALVAGLPRDPSPTGAETLAADTLRRWNCLGCHIRDGQGGTTLGPQLAAALATDPGLGVFKGTLTPPNLSSVGDKLRPAYLGQAVRGAAPTARPWLAVRMPAVAFEPGEADALAAYFQGRDRMDGGVGAGTDAAARRDRPTPPHPDAATFETAVSLIGQRGFGCVNCHVLAGKIPPGGEPETLGPDLALAQLRMTERYFDRWIGNPQRIIPGTPMPQFLQPVATVTDTLDGQLDTLWELLGSDRVGEAAAQGTREILKRQGDRPMVVRDMVLLPDAPGTEYTPRGVAIGLKNDHALLFDSDRLTWLGAWHRGFLSRTKSGRLWEWHPEGDRLWVAAHRLPPVVFADAQGKVLLPREVRDRFGRFAELDFDGADVRLTYALNPPESHGAAPIEIEETIHPTDSGWERAARVMTDPLPDSLRAVLVVSTPESSANASTFSWNAGTDAVTLRVEGASPAPAATRLADDPTARLFFLDRGQPARIQLSVRPGAAKPR